jgi:hypothetical protein
LSKTFSHSPVDDIEVGKSSLLIPSFTHVPSGEAKFRMILAVPLGFGLHIMPLIFALSGLSFGSNGPAAKPCFIQSATASVTSGPYWKALGALVLLLGSLAGPLQPMSAPCLKSLQIFGRSGSESRKHFFARFMSLSGQTNDFVFVDSLFGKAFQNSVGATIL